VESLGTMVLFRIRSSLADYARGEIVTSPLESHVKDISSDSRLFKPFKSLQANQDLNLKP